ncbi:hypothetical protein [Roseateles saccharophilus]|uniref:Nitrogen fixation protein FixH n=1 Tax=Roseateles saccharophilus TaxID=304 RepID=A0A4R3VHX9_ROSSA|nr:hypothetical protein [Roseateles saccharophilus]MDG0832500.1 hypothetical protein [Roseateles saccharophilus]TCV03961.1 hypothetical protein EV671_1002230 [Roseateles saccharophilus]
MDTTLTSPPASAWREPMVWLVVAGPAIVVVASFVSLALAIRHPDPPLELHQATAQAADDVEPADLRAREGDVVPAMVARNHAATGTAGQKR